MVHIICNSGHEMILTEDVFFNCIDDLDFIYFEFMGVQDVS